MSKESFDRRIARIAARQYGVLSREQAIRSGGTKGVIQSRLRSGRWERMLSGVYRVNGVPASWHQTLMAACLACGSECAISHRPAAALWRFPGSSEGAVELSVPADGRRTRGFVVHRVLLASVDVTRRAGIPVTTAVRTVIDLASVEEANVVEEALDDAFRRGLFTRATLDRRLEELGRSGRSGIGSIREIVSARWGGPGPQSVLETRLRRLLEDAGLPVPALQHEIRDGTSLVAVVDFAFPELRIAVEADGYRWHGSRLRFQHDLARRNSLTALGWRVIHVTWWDVMERPDETIRTITGAVQT